MDPALADTAPLLEAAALAYARNAEPVFGPMDFALRPGEIVLVEGDNGSGKTTLLKVLSGLLAPTSGTITLHGEPLALSPREHAVLRVLVQRSGEPFSKQQILDRVFSDDEDVHPEAVEVFVHRLRKRLDGSGVRITTLRGLGYALEANDVAPP